MWRQVYRALIVKRISSSVHPMFRDNNLQQPLSDDLNIGGWVCNTNWRILQEYGIENLLGVPFPYPIYNKNKLHCISLQPTISGMTKEDIVVAIFASFVGAQPMLVDKEFPLSNHRTRDNNGQCVEDLVRNFHRGPDCQRMALEEH
ncbi:hypothetical protein Tco_0517880 [Tanacetum coccineum]